MSLQKNSITIYINKDLLLDFKRILFKEGISSDSFFHYIVSKASMRDEQILSLIQEAAEAHKNKTDLFSNLNTASSNKEMKNIDAEMIYDMIEKQLQNKANEGEAENQKEVINSNE